MRLQERKEQAALCFAYSSPSALKEQEGLLQLLFQALPLTKKSEVLGSGEFGLPWDMPKKKKKI